MNTNWQPIGTVPKDGTRVDLWIGGELPRREPGASFGKGEHSCGEAGQYCDSDWHSMEPIWIDDYTGYPIHDSEKATHWMPLPEPP